MKHYLFINLETDKRFLIKAIKSSQAFTIAEEKFTSFLYLGKLTEEQAEASGLDEY